MKIAGITVCLPCVKLRRHNCLANQNIRNSVDYAPWIIQLRSASLLHGWLRSNTGAP